MRFARKIERRSKSGPRDRAPSAASPAPSSASKFRVRRAKSTSSARSRAGATTRLPADARDGSVARPEVESASSPSSRQSARRFPIRTRARSCRRRSGSSPAPPAPRARQARHSTPAAEPECDLEGRGQAGDAGADDAHEHGLAPRAWRRKNCHERYPPSASSAGSGSKGRRARAFRVAPIGLSAPMAGLPR